MESAICIGLFSPIKAYEYKQRINEEFIAMKKQGMESFMMFMSELADHCNESNIPYGFSRGSVGGSLVAYITDITDVDPIIWNTVFTAKGNCWRILCNRRSKNSKQLFNGKIWY